METLELTEQKAYKVALVEDDVFMREFVAAFTVDQGYEIVTYPSGEEFIKSLSKKSRPDILLLDYHLDMDGESMDGKDVLGALRDLAITLPTIMLTGQTDITKALECMSLGSVDYVQKGDDMEAKLIVSLKDTARHLELEKYIPEIQASIKKSRKHLLLTFTAIFIVGVVFWWVH